MAEYKKVTVRIRQDQHEKLKDKNTAKEIRESLDYKWATSPGEENFKIIRSGE